MSARLILADDDNAVREVTAATLRELGYTVLEAGSGGAALELLERSANVDLMLISGPPCPDDAAGCRFRSSRAIRTGPRSRA
jgi:DNA-binding NtrC family response regulator